MKIVSELHFLSLLVFSVILWLHIFTFIDAPDSLRGIMAGYILSHFVVYYGVTRERRV